MPTVDFVTLVISLREHVMMNGPLWKLVTAFCWIGGVLIGMGGLLQLREIAENQRHSYRAPMASAIAMIFLIGLPELVSSMVVSSFGNDWGVNPLSYVKDPGGSNVGFNAVMTLVSFIGLVFYARGAWIIKEAGEPQRYPQSTIGKAVVVLVAGMFALHIDFTLKMLANTFSFDISSYVN